MKISKMLRGGGIVIALAAALVFSACSNSSSDGGPAGGGTASCATKTEALSLNSSNATTWDEADAYNLTLSSDSATLAQSGKPKQFSNFQINKSDLNESKSVKLKIENNDTTNKAVITVTVQKNGTETNGWKPTPAVTSVKVNGAEDSNAHESGITVELAKKGSSPSISKAATVISSNVVTVELFYDGAKKPDQITVGLNSEDPDTNPTTGNITISEITLSKEVKKSDIVGVWKLGSAAKFEFTSNGKFKMDGDEVGTYAFGDNLKINTVDDDDNPITLTATKVEFVDEKIKITWDDDSLAALNSMFGVTLTNPVEFEKDEEVTPPPATPTKEDIDLSGNWWSVGEGNVYQLDKANGKLYYSGESPERYASCGVVVDLGSSNRAKFVIKNEDSVSAHVKIGLCAPPDESGKTVLTGGSVNDVEKTAAELEWGAETDIAPNDSATFILKYVAGTAGKLTLALNSNNETASNSKTGNIKMITAEKWTE